MATTFDIQLPHYSRGFHLITRDIISQLPALPESGLLVVFIKHTSARAIINRPPILLADEPTGNLDPDTAWDIMELIQEINRNGTTVVISTHAKEIVDKMQKRVIKINKGVVLNDVEGGGYNNEASNMEILY